MSNLNLLCNTYPTSSSDAIAYLALGNQINKTRLRDAGALVVVMEALRGFCRSLVCAHTAYTAYAARLHSLLKLLKLLTLLTLNLSPCDMHNINHFVRVNPRTYLLHIYLSHPPVIFLLHPPLTQQPLPTLSIPLYSH